MFPNVDIKTVEEALSSVKGDVNNAAAKLAGCTDIFGSDEGMEYY